MWGLLGTQRVIKGSILLDVAGGRVTSDLTVFPGESCWEEYLPSMLEFISS